MRQQEEMVDHKATSEQIWSVQEDMSENPDDVTGRNDDEADEQEQWVDPAIAQWLGDYMGKKSPSTGARIVTLNTNRKFMMSELNWEIIYSLMQGMEIDIMVLSWY